MPNPHLQPFLQNQVSRKEFLGFLGLAAISILGFGHIIQLLTGKSLPTHDVSDGYGASAYGGDIKKR